MYRMNHKSTALQAAEEIIENYIKKQTSLSQRFRIKNKRKHPLGLFLLLGMGVALLFGGIMLFFLL